MFEIAVILDGCPVLYVVRVCHEDPCSGRIRLILKGVGEGATVDGVKRSRWMMTTNSTHMMQASMKRYNRNDEEESKLKLISYA